jgi:hypothetical protein
MTDRLEDESVWAATLYAESDPRAESKETMEVRLNSRLVKERLAIGFSWIISTWVPLQHKDASQLGRAQSDFGIGAVISASLRPPQGSSDHSSESIGDTIV